MFYRISTISAAWVALHAEIFNILGQWVIQGLWNVKVMNNLYPPLQRPLLILTPYTAYFWKVIELLIQNICGWDPVTSPETFGGGGGGARSTNWSRRIWLFLQVGPPPMDPSPYSRLLDIQESKKFYLMMKALLLRLCSLAIQLQSLPLLLQLKHLKNYNHLTIQSFFPKRL